jgi:hypothetical protein
MGTNTAGTLAAIKDPSWTTSNQKWTLFKVSQIDANNGIYRIVNAQYGMLCVCVCVVFILFFALYSNLNLGKALRLNQSTGNLDTLGTPSSSDPKQQWRLTYLSGDSNQRIYGLACVAGNTITSSVLTGNYYEDEFGFVFYDIQANPMVGSNYQNNTQKWMIRLAS